MTQRGEFITEIIDNVVMLIRLDENVTNMSFFDINVNKISFFIGEKYQ